MAKKFNKQAYIDEYKRAHYDVLRVQVPKGEKDTLRQEATAQGKSLQQYIRDAIDFYRKATR